MGISFYGRVMKGGRERTCYKRMYKADSTQAIFVAGSQPYLWSMTKMACGAVLREDFQQNCLCAYSRICCWGLLPTSEENSLARTTISCVQGPWTHEMVVQVSKIRSVLLLQGVTVGWTDWLHQRRFLSLKYFSRADITLIGRDIKGPVAQKYKFPFIPESKRSFIHAGGCMYVICLQIKCGSPNIKMLWFLSCDVLGPRNTPLGGMSVHALDIIQVL